LSRFERSLGWSVEFGLLVRGLEFTVSSLGRSIDEFEGNLFKGRSVGLFNEGFSKSDGSSLNSDGRSLDHDEIFLDSSVMGESSHWGDGLGSKIEFGGSSVVLSGFTHSVDLLVDVRSVVISVLSSSGDSEGYSGWMPCSDTGNLSETLVSLSWESSGSPSGGNSFVSLTLVDSENVNHFVLREDGVNWDVLFEKSDGIIDFSFDCSSVDLDFA